MNLREALITQGPSLELQRAASDEIARLDGIIRDLTGRYYQAQAELAQAMANARNLGVTVSTKEQQT